MHAVCTRAVRARVCTCHRRACAGGPHLRLQLDAAQLLRAHPLLQQRLKDLLALPHRAAHVGAVGWHGCDPQRAGVLVAGEVAGRGSAQALACTERAAGIACVVRPVATLRTCNVMLHAPVCIGTLGLCGAPARCNILRCSELPGGKACTETQSCKARLAAALPLAPALRQLADPAVAHRTCGHERFVQPRAPGPGQQLSDHLHCNRQPIRARCRPVKD